MPAWQPVLTAKTVFPLFFGIGVVFIILGAVLLNYSNLVSMFIHSLTHNLVHLQMSKTIRSYSMHVNREYIFIRKFSITMPFKFSYYRKKKYFLGLKRRRRSQYYRF